MAIYRQRFDERGWLENRVYDGAPEMVAALKADGHSLFVATSKDENAAQKILEHFKLKQYFVEIAGSDPQGRLADKGLLIRELLERHNLRASETVMIGDRFHDIAAAQQNGVTALGVSYGYGSLTELREAQADYICHSPTEVIECIKTLNEQKREVLNKTGNFIE